MNEEALSVAAATMAAAVFAKNPDSGTTIKDIITLYRQVRLQIQRVAAASPPRDSTSDARV